MCNDLPLALCKYPVFVYCACTWCKNPHRQTAEGLRRKPYR